MTMGNSLSQSKMKTEPSFDDDLHFYLPQTPELTKEREAFDKELNLELQRKKENPIHFENTTWTLERIFFLCLFKLTERSFDYNAACQTLRNGQFCEENSSVLKKFYSVAEKNFNIFAKSDPFLDISEMKDRNDYCYKMKFRTSEKLGSRNGLHSEVDTNARESQNEEGSNNDYVKVDIVEDVVHSPNDADEKASNAEDITTDERKERVKPRTDSPVDTSKEESTEDHEGERKEKKEEMVFEELLQLKRTGDENQKEFDANAEIRLAELNRNIEEQIKENDKQKETNDDDLEKELKASKERINEKEEIFQKTEKEKQKIHDEKIREIRERREKYEKETERIRLRDLEKIQTMTSVFLKCVELKQEWKMKEDEWSNWLKFLRSTISRIKQQFLNFEGLVLLCDTSDANDKCFIEEELHLLHNTIVSSFNTLRDAHSEVKNLLENNSDRLFLWILQCRLSKVCKAILSVLYGIDNVKIDGNLLEILRDMFSTFDSSDIFYTSKLRDLEKLGYLEEYKHVKDPDDYTPKSRVKIEEMVDELKNTVVVEEKLEENPYEGFSDASEQRCDKQGIIKDDHSGYPKEEEEHSEETEP